MTVDEALTLIDKCYGDCEECMYISSFSNSCLLRHLSELSELLRSLKEEKESHQCKYSYTPCFLRRGD